MALFGKGDSLAAIAKRLQGEALPLAETKEAVAQLLVHPEFDLERQEWMLTHGSSVVRSAAKEAAVKSGRSGLVEVAIKLFPGRPTDTRRDLAQMVIQLAGSRLQGVLATLMQSQDAEARESALEIIAAAPAVTDHLAFLKAALRDGPEKLRHRAVRILAPFASDSLVFMHLRALVNDDDTVVRRVVIEAMAKQRTAEIIEPFFERIAHEDPELRSVMTSALSQLARTDQGKIEDRLLPILGDEDSAMRDVAVRILREMPDQRRVIRSFLEHAQGLSPWLRERSAHSIQKLAGDLLDALIELLSDQAETIRVGALSMLRGISDPRIVDAVLKVLGGTDDWWVRSMAADVLKNFRDERVTDAFLRYVDDPELSYSVVAALGSQENPKAKSALVSCLGHANTGLRLTALDAIRRSPKAQDFSSALIKVVSDDLEERVREKARSILEELGVKAVDAAPSPTAQDSGPVLTPDGVVFKMVNEALNRRD